MFWNNSPPLTPFKIPLTQEDRLRNYRLLYRLLYCKLFTIDCKNGIFLKQKLPKKDKRAISKAFSRGFRIVSIHIPPTHIKRQTPISPNPKTAH